MTPQPRRVPALHGWQWLRDGARLCTRKPLTWIVYTIVTWLVVTLSGVHTILMAAVAVLLPVLMAGWTLACRAADEGKSIPVTMLFDGFRGRVRDLASIGTFNLLGNITLMLILAALGGEDLATLMSSPESLSPEARDALQSRMTIATMLILALGIPLGMAVWFAPVAVVLDNLRGPAALGASLRAIARNSAAFCVYTIVLVAVAGALYAICAAAGLTRWVAMQIAIWMLMPLLVTSVYASYRDIFTPAPEDVKPELDAPPQA